MWFVNTTIFTKYKNPSSIQGHVYISGGDSHDIHRLSPDGTFRDIVLSKHDGVHCPLGMTFNTSSIKYKNPSSIKYKDHSSIKYKNPSSIKYKNPSFTMEHSVI
jgi:hypothetical protein